MNSGVLRVYCHNAIVLVQQNIWMEAFVQNYSLMGILQIFYH